MESRVIMNEKLISEHFSFKKMCDVIQGKKGKYLDLFSDLFQLAALFIPELKLPVTMVSVFSQETFEVELMEAKNKLAQCYNSVKDLLDDNNSEKYNEHYNNIQIVNALLLYTSYFDAMSALLPDKEFHISLDSTDKLVITQDAVKNYYKRYSDSQDEIETEITDIPPLSSPVFPFEEQQKTILNFYKELNNVFQGFFENLSCYDSFTSAQRDILYAKLRKLPEKAVMTYNAEYNELKTKFSFYQSFSSTKEIQTVYTKLLEIEKKNANLIDEHKFRHTENNLDRLHTFYVNKINEKILYGKDVDDEFSMLPMIEYIFVNQSFRAITFNKKSLLAAKETWLECDRLDHLAEYLCEAINDPTVGRRPVIVLGNPGAGKSTLCNMLAAKYYVSQYHTIVIRLRNIDADKSIPEQIEEQIRNCIDTSVSWEDIRSYLTASQTRPLLLIFDGFDELLQASGKDYREYIKEIYNFQQKNELLDDIFIRAIVTSRSALIDTADIPNHSLIVNIDDFDENQINMWIEKWNKHNASYFSKNHLLPLDISQEDSCYTLSKQPLLLALLALYDYKDNALHREENDNEATLYESIIKDFIEREIKKSTPQHSSPQSSEIEEAFSRLSVAAIGMFNRNKVVLSVEELKMDLMCFWPYLYRDKEFSFEETHTVFGRFFFVNTSQSIQMKYI